MGKKLNEYQSSMIWLIKHDFYPVWDEARAWKRVKGEIEIGCKRSNGKWLAKAFLLVEGDWDDMEVATLSCVANAKSPQQALIRLRNELLANQNCPSPSVETFYPSGKPVASAAECNAARKKAISFLEKNRLIAKADLAKEEIAQ